MKMTRKICFRLAEDTGVAVITIAGGKDGKRSQRCLLHGCLLIKQQEAFQSSSNKQLKLTDCYWDKMKGTKDDMYGCSLTEADIF